jgi:hypothetical protein
MVEVLFHYWNPDLTSKLLVSVRLGAEVEQQKQEPKWVQVHQRRGSLRMRLPSRSPSAYTMYQ